MRNKVATAEVREKRRVSTTESASDGTASRAHGGQCFLTARFHIVPDEEETIHRECAVEQWLTEHITRDMSHVLWIIYRDRSEVIGVGEQ